MYPPIRLWMRLVAILWVMSFAVQADAHAALQSAYPQDGAVLPSSPEVAVMTFNEAVRPIMIRLVTPDGSQTDLTQSAPGGAVLRVPLMDLGRGTHVLTWRVVSDDGHPVAGAMVFSVGEVSSTVRGGAAGDPLVRGAMWVARLAMSAGLILSVGGAAFGAIAGYPGRARGTLALMAVVGLLASVMFIGLHGLDALGLGLAHFATPPPWRAAGGTSFGPSVAVAAGTALCTLIALRYRYVAVVALLSLGAAYAASGHASAAPPQWLSRSLVFLHLTTLSLWLGALIPLSLWLLRPGGPMALRRFSELVPYAVLVLAASGLWLAVIQLGPVPAQWLTPYGYILGAKLFLLAMLFLLALWNRRVLTAPAVAGEARATGLLRRSIGMELLLAVMILGLTASWRFTPPPRAFQAIATPAAYTHLHGADVMADVTLTPGTTGPVSAEIMLVDGAMTPVLPVSVTLGLAHPELGIERRSYPARVDGDGVWRISNLVLPFGGTWSVDLEIRLTRFSQARLSGTLDIRGENP